MRKALLAVIFASVAPAAMATAASSISAGPALSPRAAIAAPEGIVTRVDYRGYRPYRRYYRGPRAYGYYAPRAAYYAPRPAYYARPPAYYAPPAVVYYPPPVIVYPPPVVYGAYAPVAPRYYGADYYGDYADW
jgi:hypothetical protein